MREFFKPTRLKIILTLLVVVLVIPFIGYDTGIRCITTPCPSFDHTTLWDFFIYQSDNPYAANSYKISWIRMAGGIFAFYFLACLAIPIVRKAIGATKKE